jgi:hypothetical protein
MRDFIRFATLCLGSLLVFGLVADGLPRYAAVSPLIAGAIGLAAGILAIVACRRLAGRRAADAGTTRHLALTVILCLALLVDYALFATLLVRQPLVQPLALLILSSVATFIFATAGYLRLTLRSVTPAPSRPSRSRGRSRR